MSSIIDFRTGTIGSFSALESDSSAVEYSVELSDCKVESLLSTKLIGEKIAKKFDLRDDRQDPAQIYSFQV